jgi:MULE transposase domain
MRLRSYLLCVDSTHGTNRYGFLHYTLLTLDECFEGVPVAHMICNREESADIVGVFFRHVQSRMSKEDFLRLRRSCHWFMSDDKPFFFTVFSRVFDCMPHRLLCSWHVRRNWCENLNAKVKDEATRAEIQEALVNVRDEVDETKFRILLQESIAEWETVAPEFAQYFRRFYMDRAEEWAYCFRVEGNG